MCFCCVAGGGGERGEVGGGIIGECNLSYMVRDIPPLLIIES